MTVKQLYQMASWMTLEAPDYDDDLKSAFPHILNQILAEALDYENQFRRLENMPLLKTEDIPLYDNADDERELPFHEILCRSALPLGIKAAFFEGESLLKAESVLTYNKYVSALQELTPAVFVEIGSEDE